MSEAEVPSSSTSSSSLIASHPGTSNIVQQQLNELTTTMAVAAAVASTTAAASTSSNASVAVVEELVGGVIKMDSSEATEETEPVKKKLKMGEEEQTGEPAPEKLENRLFSVLSCAVCLDLPKGIVYQCSNGHLTCAGCFTHLLADCRLRDETATCPNCRVEINRNVVSRNLAVEKAISELPDTCQFCNKEFPRHSLDRHERELCIERTMTCKYSKIGCPWRGPYFELNNHEASCCHPQKSGAEVMDVLRLQDLKIEEEKRLNSIVFDLLSCEKITFNDLQLKPYRTDEFVHKLYYETSRFQVFGNMFVVKARISTPQRDPTQSCERQLEYQLILKQKPTPATLDVSFVVLKGPFGDMKLNPKIHRFEFTEQNNESPHFLLPLVDCGECNRVLAAKTIHFRLIVFLQ